MKEYKVKVTDSKTEWYNLNDERHREDGPAREYANGTKEWYINGERLTETEFNQRTQSCIGKIVEYASGTKEWYNLNGELHREDGPAIEWAVGTKCWYINGELHREDGPAVEYADGTKEWYINGECLTETEFNQRTESCIGKIVEIDGKKYKLNQI